MATGMMATTRQIPYVDLAAQHRAIKPELMEAVGAVFDRGDFILGDEVEAFEARFAELCQAPHAVALNSGTDALVLALRALGIGPGDEVITVPNSFVASAGCIALTGATPVFVDVGDDYNMDPSLLQKAVSPRTKAILPVHLTGRPVDMDPLMDVAQQHGLFVVEDCAQAVLAEYRGRSVGSIGTVGCFSLHPLKTLNACGDGGVLTTADEDVYERVKVLRNLGLRTRDDCVQWSGNSRLDTIQAAILLVKMGYLDTWTEKRRANALVYQELLDGIPSVDVPEDRPHEKAVYHTFVVQSERRDHLKRYLEEQGVGTAVHYSVPIHLQGAAAGLGYGPGSFPVTERQAERILSLPVYPELARDDLEYVARAIREFYRA